METESGAYIGKMKAIAKQYPDEEMAEGVLAYWRENGVKKELYDADGDGKYSVFTPLDMEPGKTYALVYCNHAGMTPINQYETCGFPMLAGREKFICVCPWNGGPSNDNVVTEFPRILRQMEEQGYPVDFQRIYVTGFSAGSDATGALATAYPERIAAISPDPGANMFLKGKWCENPSSYEKNLPLAMPLICMGGTMDGGDRYPLDTEQGIRNFNLWMRDIVKADAFEEMTEEKARELSEGCTDRCKKIFGINFQRTYSFRQEGREWYVGEYDRQGIVCARFICGEGVPHTQTRYHAAILWDFLKHFRRDTATGESIYDPIVVNGYRD
jgi:poly(3-hydroxybutyrate) depolymerase